MKERCLLEECLDSLVRGMQSGIARLTDILGYQSHPLLFSTHGIETLLHRRDRIAQACTEVGTDEEISVDARDDLDDAQVVAHPVEGGLKGGERVMGHQPYDPLRPVLGNEEEGSVERVEPRPRQSTGVPDVVQPRCRHNVGCATAGDSPGDIGSPMGGSCTVLVDLRVITQHGGRECARTCDDRRGSRGHGDSVLRA
ncbi:MAG: hypothetical protein RL134_1984 [Actinomycetota bacterium]|jgi:hypothetical protein